MKSEEVFIALNRGIQCSYKIFMATLVFVLTIDPKFNFNIQYYCESFNMQCYWIIYLYDINDVTHTGKLLSQYV